MDRKILEVMKALHTFEEQKRNLNNLASLGMMSVADAANEYEELTKKQKSLRVSFVKQRHVRGDGSPRIIKHHEPTDAYKEDYYITILPGGKRLRASTKDALIEKLYLYYIGEYGDNTVGAIFKKALKEKAVTENPNPNTIRKNEADFKRFITDAFAHMDIREVNDTAIKTYLQTWVNEHHPKKAVFLSMKGILNLIFDYALRNGIIARNPLISVKNRVYMKSCDTSRPKPGEKILSKEEIRRLQDEIRSRFGTVKYGDYYINGYACLFSIETGVRVGELCAIRWEDIHETHIHIHSQQLFRLDSNGNPEYYYVPYTKNEKGVSEDGRDYPMTDAIRRLLDELAALQKKYGIESEFVFCHEDGEWIKTKAYLTFLRRICTTLGFKVTNNHALRMSLNSNVLLPLGISPANRAAMLGHSVQTNLQFYSYAEKDYIDDVRKLLNTAENGNSPEKDTQNAEKDTSNLVFFQKARARKA